MKFMRKMKNKIIRMLSEKLISKIHTIGNYVVLTDFALTGKQAKVPRHIFLEITEKTPTPLAFNEIVLYHIICRRVSTVEISEITDDKSNVIYISPTLSSGGFDVDGDVAVVGYFNRKHVNKLLLYILGI